MSAEIDPEWKGLRWAPDGTLCWNGWAVFGHILPLIAFVQHPCGADGEPAEIIGEAPDVAFTIEVLALEWLGRGYAIRLPWARPKRV